MLHYLKLGLCNLIGQFGWKESSVKLTKNYTKITILKKHLNGSGLNWVTRRYVVELTIVANY